MEIAEEIMKAKKSVKIVSPYLTPSYVEDLLKLANKGINITLITSNEIEKDNSGEYSNLSDTDLIKQKRITNKESKKERDKGMLLSGIGLGLSFLIFIISHSVPLVIVSIISLIALLYFYKMRIYSYSYYSPIKLKVVPNEYYDRKKGKYFLHSKIFVIDDKIAFVGSVNYTYKAFRSNYETITRIKTYQAVEEISKEVDRLFYDKSLYSKPINEWGEELYDEKPY